MIKISAIFIIIVAAGTVFSQTQNNPAPKYSAARGRCGTVYYLANAPRFFDNPQTKAELETVVRVLQSAPPEADVECRDFTDAWAPYLYATRKTKIAELLIRLERFAEAREELWSVFSKRPVIYGNRKLFYSFRTENAVELLLGEDLWDKKDFSARLKSGKYFTEDLEEAYQNHRAPDTP